MNVSLLFTITIFLISLTPTTYAESHDRPILHHKCNSNDKNVLFQIKESFGNPYILSSWTHDTDCCEWYCVECDEKTSRINALRIFQDNIFSGQIPDAIGDLPFLESIFFHHLPNLTGTIPKTITKLTHLKELIVSYTNISGPIPSFLSQIKTLTLLDLSFNNLSGSIPPSLSQLNLGALHLDRNKLTGQIPDSFGHFTGTVPDLYLSHNQLTGPIPKSLGNLKFYTIDLSSNQLVGDPSFLFGANKIFWWLDLSRNKFEFDLSKVVFPKSLFKLDLNHNKIYGSMPSGLLGLELQFLNVSYNRLCGKIPQGGSLQRFTKFEYFHNRCLCGAPLSACK